MTRVPHQEQELDNAENWDFEQESRKWSRRQLRWRWVDNCRDFLCTGSLSVTLGCGELKMKQKAIPSGSRRDHDTKPRGSRQLPKRVSRLRTPTRRGDPRSTQPSRTLLWRLFTRLCSNIVLATTLILPTPNQTGILQFISGKRLREPMNMPHLRHLRHGGHVGPVLLWLIYKGGQQNFDGDTLRNNS